MTESSGRTGQTRLAPFVQRVLIVAAITVLLLLLWEWRQVLLLVFGSVLIAVGLHGVADPIVARTPLNRTWSLAAAALIVIGVLGGVFWLFGSQVSGQVSQLGERLPDAWTRVREQLMGLPGGEQLVSGLESMPGQSSNPDGMRSAFVRVGGFTMTALGVALDALVVIVAAIFMAVSPGPYKKGVLKLAPQSIRPALDETMEETGGALKRWLGATLISMSSIAIMVSLALMFLGVPAFLALGLVAGLSQFVPVVGPVLAAVPGVLLAFTVSPMTAVWTALAYFVASQLEANIIYPIIQRKAVDIPSALILFSIIAMGALFGPMGVLLAVPLTVVAVIFVKRFYVRDTLMDEDVQGGP